MENLGIQFGGIHSGIKVKVGKKVQGTIYAAAPMTGCGFFTTNRVNSGSVKVSKQHLRNNSSVRLVIANSGNANCFTGTDYQDAKSVAAKAAKAWRVKEKEVLVCSTGVIGKRLPFEKITGNFDAARESLTDSWDDFSEAILTTDTVKKVTTRSFSVGKETGFLLGIGKGAGMIYPDLATTLAFFCTNVRIAPKLLREAAREALEDSFMSISIDGCQSTNDTVLFLSSSKTVKEATAGSKEYTVFKKALREVTLSVAKKIVADAEGIHHFITIEVRGARTYNDAEKVAFAIAHSALFKASVYGKNPSVGRVAAAAGSCGAYVDEQKIKITVDKPSAKEVQLAVHLHVGKAEKTVYTSDLTPEYVLENVI